jgi:hypothetical protein
VAEKIEEDGFFVNTITFGGWRPGVLRAASEKLAGLVKLKLASLPRNTLVVLPLLDSAAFYDRTNNGSLIPYRREALTSRFYVDDDLTLALSEALTHS